MPPPSQAITRRSFLGFLRILFPVAAFMTAPVSQAQAASSAFDSAFDQGFF